MTPCAFCLPSLDHVKLTLQFLLTTLATKIFVVYDDKWQDKPVTVKYESKEQ